MSGPSVNITEVVSELRARWKKQMDDTAKQSAYYQGCLDGVDTLLSKITVPVGSGGEPNT